MSGLGRPWAVMGVSRLVHASSPNPDSQCFADEKHKAGGLNIQGGKMATVDGEGGGRRPELLTWRDRPWTRSSVCEPWFHYRCTRWHHRGRL